MRIVIIIFESLALLMLLLYLLSTYSAMKKVKETFKCNKCGKENDILTGKCKHCGNKMKQWVGIYVTCIRQRKSCKNDEEHPVLKKALKYIVIDYIIELSAIALLTYNLAVNIVYLINK